MRPPTAPKLLLLSLLLAWTFAGCGSGQEVSFDPQKPEAASIIVSVDGVEATVVLADLETVPFEDVQAYSLWDILLAAGLDEETLPSLCFDFEASDGFRPSSVGCECLAGETLELCYLDPAGLSLVWDASLGLRGCYWVREVAKVLGETA